MSKTMCLIRAEKQEGREQFASRIHKIAEQLAMSSDVTALKYTITDLAPPKLSVIPFNKDLLASMSIYGIPKVPDALQSIAGTKGLYKVEEVFPIAYEKDWPDGERTPGVNLVTLFRRRVDIDHSNFLHRWHNGHTPLSLKIHPMWNYSRNVVLESIAESQSLDGIVEEHFRTRADLLNPFRFFGNPLVILPNMVKVYLDVKRFIDYSSIETYLASEYHIKS